jgi:hypothetical protein
MSADTAAPLPNEWKPSFNPWLLRLLHAHNLLRLTIRLRGAN